MSVEKRTPISVKEAIKRIMKQHVEVKNININLDESLGHILAEDIVATYDIPRFNKSPYDGFAIRSEDSQGASGENRIEFEVIDHIGAGSVSEKTIDKNQAIRIMTGAQIPSGADAVVMFEQTIESETTFTIRKSFKHLENISLQGEEIKAKMHTLTKTIKDSPDLDSVLKPTILSYQDELNQINNQIHQLEQDKQAEAPHYDADMIANILQTIFKDIDKLEKSQLKSLYLTVIDRIDIRRDEQHKKQFYVTLKLNNDIIKQLFNNHPLDEVLLSTSSLFLSQTLYLTI